MACPTVALSKAEVWEALAALPNWHYKENALERVYQAQTYLEGLDKLNVIAQLSESANHHPDLILGWRQLTVRYWTHTAGGVTPLDFELAQRAEHALIRS
jgi:4a-hydroxytetrahydrobiopterin dehydratase